MIHELVGRADERRRWFQPRFAHAALIRGVAQNSAWMVKDRLPGIVEDAPMALTKQMSHRLAATLVVVRVDARPRRIRAGVDQDRRDLVPPEHVQHRRGDQTERDASVEAAVAE